MKIMKQSKLNIPSSDLELSTILSSVPLFIMVVDHERKVQRVSDSILEFTDQTMEDVLGARGGEALRCVHHLDDPKGCGFGPSCNSCIVRQVVSDTLKTGNQHNKAEATLSFIGDERERFLLVTTRLIKTSEKKAVIFVEDITDRKQKELEREKLINELEKALSEVKKLSGLLPICSHCKKIRDDKGYWNQIESYIHDHSEAEFSHSICQECAKEHYPDMDIYGD